MLELCGSSSLDLEHKTGMKEAYLPFGNSVRTGFYSEQVMRSRLAYVGLSGSHLTIEVLGGVFLNNPRKLMDQLALFPDELSLLSLLC